MLTLKTNLVNLPLSVATTSILVPLAHYLPDMMMDKIKCQMFYKLSFSLHQPTLLPIRSFYFTEFIWSIFTCQNGQGISLYPLRESLKNMQFWKINEKKLHTKINKCMLYV